MDTLIFNSYVGGACVFEYHKGETELLRVNDRFISETGIKLEDDSPFSVFDLYQYMSEDDQRSFGECAERAAATGVRHLRAFAQEQRRTGRNPA